MKKFLFVLPLFVYFLFAAQTPVTQAQVRPTPTNIATNAPETTGNTNQSSDAKGSIRGAVYNDTNLDYKCTAEDDAGISGVPLSFTQDGYIAATLETGDDGTFGLVGAKFGWWDVSITAPAGYRVVGADMLTVNIIGGSHADETVTNVNFCITKAAATGGNTGATGGDNCGVWPNGVRPANCNGGTGSTTQTGANCNGVWPNGVRPANCSATTNNGGTTNTNTGTGVLLPQAGADTAPTTGLSLLLWAAVAGLMFIGVGVGLEVRRRQTVDISE